MFKLEPRDIACIERAVNLSLESSHANAGEILGCGKVGLIALFHGLREVGVSLPHHPNTKHGQWKKREERCPTQSAKSPIN